MHARATHAPRHGAEQTPAACAEMEDIRAMLKHHQLCSDILYKELFVPAEELKGAAASRLIYSLHLLHACP